MSFKNRILFIYILSFSYLLHLTNSSFEDMPNEPNWDMPKDKNKNSDVDVKLLNELREKTMNVTEEGNNLKIKQEIYSFYVKLLLSLNVIFGIVLISYAIYLIFFSKKKKNSNNILNELINENNNSLEENQIFNEKNSLNLIKESNEKSSNVEDLNSSGIEAPTIEKYYQNTNH